jgi:hypothetical protein
MLDIHLVAHTLTVAWLIVYPRSTIGSDDEVGALNPLANNWTAIKPKEI